MMLRVSSKVEGEAAELGAITEGAEVESGVPGQTPLLNLVEGALNGGDGLPSAREAVASELGEAALVDAAAVIGNFQRMTRIADSTGIPIDEPMVALSADVREELDLARFRSAANTLG